MDDEILIDLVRQNPMLYDTSHPKYMDPKFKSSIWKDIGGELKVTNKHCKSRWSNIRDQFKKHLAKRQARSEPAKNKKYKYENILQFLLPYMNEKQSKSQTKAKLEAEELDSNQEETEGEESFPLVLSAYLSTKASENPKQLEQTRISLKKKYPSAESPPSVSRSEIENKDGQHPIDAFLAGIGATIKTFSVYHQHIAKGRIFSVVQDLELKELQNDD